MTPVDLLTLISGVVVGFTLGVIGGGGSILALPLLMYVVGMKDPHVAIGTSALAVAANAFANLVQHGLAGTVKWPCALVFGASGVVVPWSAPLSARWWLASTSWCCSRA